MNMTEFAIFIGLLILGLVKVILDYVFYSGMYKAHRDVNRERLDSAYIRGYDEAKKEMREASASMRLRSAEEARRKERKVPAE